MKLKSFGCSFIYGSELSDESATRKFSQLTWPALLSQKLKLPYSTWAYPGDGNLLIASHCLDQLATGKPAFYVVNWTWIDRFDFVDLERTPNEQRGQWDTLRPGKNNHLHGDFYYRNLHSELRDKIVTLQQIKLVTDTLLASGQPFIMTYMDELIFDQRWHITPAMIQQQNFVQPVMQHWPGGNWCLWANRKGHEITDSGHLLESGHELVFNDLYQKLCSDKIPTASQFCINKV